MAKKGGYQIIDLKNRNFASGSQSTYNGIYDLVEGTQKTILVSGVTLAGVERRDEYVTPTIVGTTYTLSLTYATITISDTDVVTVTAKA